MAWRRYCGYRSGCSASAAACSACKRLPPLPRFDPGILLVVHLNLQPGKQLAGAGQLRGEPNAVAAAAASVLHPHPHASRQLLEQQVPDVRLSKGGPDAACIRYEQPRRLQRVGVIRELSTLRDAAQHHGLHLGLPPTAVHLQGCPESTASTLLLVDAPSSGELGGLVPVEVCDVVGHHAHRHRIDLVLHRSPQLALRGGQVARLVVGATVLLQSVLLGLVLEAVADGLEVLPPSVQKHWCPLGTIRVLPDLVADGG